MKVENISQDYNDNVNNTETELCFQCHTYKSINNFTNCESKYTCNECFGIYKKLCKEKGIVFKEIEKARNCKSITKSYWLNDVYAIKGKKETFIRGYNPEKEDYHYPEHEKSDIFSLKMQFLKSNGKFICFYSGFAKKQNPFDFVKFMEQNNASFSKHFKNPLEEERGLEFWDFHGNLERVSNSFKYRIFDIKTENKLRNEIINLNKVVA